MSNFTYLSTESDLVQDASSVTASSENASFPGSNLRYEKSVPLANVWKSVAAVTNPTVLFDFGASHSWNIVAILNHNLTSAATVTLTAGTTNACSDFSQVMTWREFDIYYRHGSTLTYRYMKLAFSDAANPDTYISVGAVLVGLTVTLGSGFETAPSFTYEAGQRVNLSDLKVISVDRLADPIEFTVKWIPFRESNRSELITFLRALHGAAIPLFIILDTATYEGYYCRQVSSPKDIRQFKPDVSSSTFREESRGKKLA